MGLIEKITENKSILGLECFLSAENNLVFSGMSLRKASSVISTEKIFDTSPALAEMLKGEKKLPPAILVITGKGIIHKHVSWNESDDPKSLLNKALPNANLTDFYIQQSRPFNGKVLISVARRSQVDQILDQCAACKLEVIGCLLGPAVMENILPLLKSEGGYQYDFLFSEYKLSVVDNHLENFTGANPPLDGEALLGEERVPFNRLLPFAGAFSLLAGLQLPELIIDRIQVQKEENRQKLLFQFSLASLVGLFLVVMLVNFLVIDHYRTKNQQLGQQLALNRDILQKLDTLKVEFQRKQGFLERTGMLQASRVSSYADDLGRDMPPAILLSGMNINPWQKPKTEEDKISFEKKALRMTGICNQSIELNDWMQELKKKSWVKNLVLLNYSQGKGMQSGEFSLQLEIK
jgi:Tfp pilus assembly protein PilN